MGEYDGVTKMAMGCTDFSHGLDSRAARIHFPAVIFTITGVKLL